MSVYRLGRLIGELHAGNPDLRRSPFCEITDEQLNEHMIVLGRTGRGKSRFLNQLIREMFLARRCAVLFDPDGDLCDDLSAWAARQMVETGSKSILRRFHVIEPSPFLVQRYDPFRFWLPKTIHPELLPSVQRAWLHVKVDHVAQAIQRNTGAIDFEAMPRLYRMLTDVLTIVGTMVDGRHLPLADAALLLDFTRPEARQIYDRVASKLPRHVCADFRILFALFERGRIEDLLRQTESSLNRVRTQIGPVLQGVFSTSGTEPTFNFYDVFQRGDIVLVNLRQTPFFGAEQGKALANLLIYDAFMTALITPREKRKPVSLIIDEASEYVTPDIAVMLRRGRKYFFSLVLAAQNLDSFRRKDVDLRPFVLSQPSTIVAFNQRLPEDTALLARTLFTGILDFTPLVHEVERDGGNEFIPVVEGSISHQDSASTTKTVSKQNKIDISKQETKGRAEQIGWSVGDNWTHTEGDGENDVIADTLGQGHGINQSPIIVDGKVNGILRLLSDQTSANQTKTKGQTRQITDGRGGSTTKSGSVTNNVGEGNGIAIGASEGESHADGTGESDGVSLSVRFAQIHKVVREIQETGQLKQSIADQIERFAQILFLLRRRQAVVLRDTEVCVMESLDVPDPFESPEALVRAVDWVRQQLREIHPYQFVPDLTPGGEAERLRELLASLGNDQNNEADQPNIVDGDDRLA